MVLTSTWLFPACCRCMMCWTKSYDAQLLSHPPTLTNFWYFLCDGDYVDLLPILAIPLIVVSSPLPFSLSKALLWFLKALLPFKAPSCFPFNAHPPTSKMPCLLNNRTFWWEFSVSFLSWDDQLLVLYYLIIIIIIVFNTYTYLHRLNTLIKFEQIKLADSWHYSVCAF